MGYKNGNKTKRKSEYMAHHTVTTVVNNFYDPNEKERKKKKYATIENLLDVLLVNIARYRHLNRDRHCNYGQGTTKRSRKAQPHLLARSQIMQTL